MGFDDEGNRNHLILLFLVGDRPTTGVREAALESAIEQIARFRGRGGCDGRPRIPLQIENEKELSLLGPNFSGSAPSIDRVIREWNSGCSRQNFCPHFNLVPGTASAISKDLLTEWHDAKVGLTATHIFDDQAEKKIICYLKGILGARDYEIAYLSEATTALGRAPTAPTLPEISHFYFPMHISRLREASNFGRPLQERLGLEQGNVAFPVEDQEEIPFIPPTYSPRTVAYDDLVLANTLASAHRAGIRYYIVQSTDNRDLIFLIHELRIYCPNCIAITGWNDQLFLHSDVNSDLLGTLVLSEYPLFSLSQRWTRKDTDLADPQQFPVDLAEGVYNATLVLLGGMSSGGW